MNEQLFRMEDKIDKIGDLIGSHAVLIAQIHERIGKISEVEKDMNSHIKNTAKELKPIKDHVKIVGYVLKTTAWLIGGVVTTALAVVTTAALASLFTR